VELSESGNTYAAEVNKYLHTKLASTLQHQHKCAARKIIAYELPIQVYPVALLNCAAIIGIAVVTIHQPDKSVTNPSQEKVPPIQIKIQDKSNILIV